MKKIYFPLFILCCFNSTFLTTFAQDNIQLEEENVIQFKKGFKYLHSAQIDISNKVHIDLTDPIKPSIIIINNDSLMMTPVLASPNISTIRRSGNLIGMIQITKHGGYINLNEDYWKLEYNKDEITISDLEYKKDLGEEKTIKISRFGKELVLKTRLEKIPPSIIPIIMNLDINRRVKIVTPEFMDKISPYIRILNLMSTVNSL